MLYRVRVVPRVPGVPSWRHRSPAQVVNIPSSSVAVVSGSAGAVAPGAALAPHSPPLLPPRHLLPNLHRATGASAAAGEAADAVRGAGERGCEGGVPADLPGAGGGGYAGEYAGGGGESSHQSQHLSGN